MQKPWDAKLDWDDQLDLEFSGEWSKILKIFDFIEDFKFKRTAFTGNFVLLIFCDCFQRINVFSCYCRGLAKKKRVGCYFLSAKMPQKIKLYQVRNFSPFLATKCLNSISKSIVASIILDFRVFIDAQLVLSWVLAGKVTAKNVFACNRISDITCSIKNIEENFGLQCKSSHVNLEFYPADFYYERVISP